MYNYNPITISAAIYVNAYFQLNEKNKKKQMQWITKHKARSLMDEAKKRVPEQRTYDYYITVVFLAARLSAPVSLSA